MPKSFDVAVIGAGVFGVWTACSLQRGGHAVVLIDAYGVGNSRASSGGDSRVIRLGYGSEEMYTRWAIRSLDRWKELFQDRGLSLLVPTGVLWMGHADDPLTDATATTLARLGVRAELLSHDDLERRYPQFDFGPIVRGVYEPDSGVLLARRAAQAVVQEAMRLGTAYRLAFVEPPRGNGRLTALTLRDGTRVHAGTFVFACGPWLPKLFPVQLAPRIHSTRQEVFYFGCPPGDPRFVPPAMPAWVDFQDGFYGLPDLEGRGFKIGLDGHGPPFDPDAGERVVTAEALQAAREFLARRVPPLKDAPLLEARVCQYANSWNGDFLIDRHPDFDNVWLVGGGSGHGFKHGPAVGEYVTALIEGRGEAEPRFALATKGTVRHREIY